MVAIPVAPSFAASETPTVAKLNQLSSLVSFATQCPVVVSLKSFGATTSMSTSGVVSVNWGTKECDSDGMFSSSAPTLITAKTPGYYKVHCVVAVNIAGNADYQLSARQVYGSSNPNGAAGTVVLFGASTAGSSAVTSDFMSLHVSALSPMMYAGDSIRMDIFSSNSTGLTVQNGFDYTGNLSLAGCRDGASAFQCYLASEGP